MVKKNRKAREDIKKKDFDLSKPINVLGMGSDDDPCFGKHYDLVSPECRACGDSEFCIVANSQNLKSRGITVSSQQRFKDIEEADKELTKKRKKAKKLIKEYQGRGLKKFKILIKVSEEINLPKSEVKQLLN